MPELVGYGDEDEYTADLGSGRQDVDARKHREEDSGSGSRERNSKHASKEKNPWAGSWKRREEVEPQAELASARAPKKFNRDCKSKTTAREKASKQGNKSLDGSRRERKGRSSTSARPPACRIYSDSESSRLLGSAERKRALTWLGRVQPQGTELNSAGAENSIESASELQVESPGPLTGDLQSRVSQCTLPSSSELNSNYYNGKRRSKQPRK
ncbi:hypothetical protein B0H12DRAFT_1215759 [Mycena haematopus]|nr:hypothetical protein B0H12DRAFT_1215759 [Mycena haematopus]